MNNINNVEKAAEVFDLESRNNKIIKSTLDLHDIYPKEKRQTISNILDNEYKNTSSVCFEGVWYNRKERLIELAKKNLDELDFVYTESLEYDDENTENRIRLNNIRSNVKSLILSKYTFNGAIEDIINFLKLKYIFKSINEDGSEEIWFYNKGIYLPHGRNLICAEVRIILEDDYKTTIGREVCDKLRLDSFVDKDIFFNSQNNNPYLLPVNNGILDLKSKELKAFNSEYYFFSKLEYDYNSSADCPRLKKFFRDVVAREEDALILEEMFGFCLVKNYFLETAFMLEGKSASNGKSTLLNILQNFLGLNNCSSLSIGKDKVAKDNFSDIDLHNKLVNISNELSSNDLRDQDGFKRLMGDLIRGNRKNQTAISFRNYAKLIFTSNELPVVPGADEGFKRRWLRINFPYKFVSEKEFNKLKASDVDSSFVKLADPKIKNDFDYFSKQEYEGLLVLALEGLSRIFATGSFSSSLSVDEQWMEWERISSSIKSFVNECIIEDYDSWITKEEFRREYGRYCRNHKIKAVSDKVIKITIENDVFATEKRISLKSLENGQVVTNRELVWSGLRFNKESKINNSCDQEFVNGTLESPIVVSEEVIQDE